MWRTNKARYPVREGNLVWVDRVLVRQGRYPIKYPIRVRDDRERHVGFFQDRVDC